MIKLLDDSIIKMMMEVSVEMISNCENTEGK